MIATEVIKHIEQWAPPGAGWDKDNVGIQVGSRQIQITNILICLELTSKVLEEAIKKKCNLIITHHPFIFNPIKKLDLSKPQNRLIEKLIKNNITLFSAHTNLDFTKGGVSHELAKVLKLKNTRFLVNEEQNQVKLVVFVPEKNLDSVSQAVFEAGGGVIGEYKKCSYMLQGKGTFEGSQETNPVIGKKMNFEVVDEIRFEALVDEWKLKDVVSAMLKVHPYEEPAYDIYKLNNSNLNYGYGVIGELPKSLTQSEFLNHVCENLKIKNIRYTNGKKGKIKTVAVCGGSGSDLLGKALSQNADAYVTADIKYHSFQEAEGNILFVDAGHYETEINVLNAVKLRLDDLISKSDEKIKIYKFSGSTNPVKFYNN